ncbi:MAG: hypothetical protein HY231_11725 [Acidobacteria bacterium]|nr:hypothetical protein [Acidobacteriota bacterium]
MNISTISETGKGILVGVLVGVIVGVGGYLLVRGNHQLEYKTLAVGEFGIVMFVVIPILTGFSIAVVTKPPYLRSGVIVSAILCLALLLCFGLEGLFCCVMASPILAFSLSIGAAIGYVVRKHILVKAKNQTQVNLLVLAVIPFLISGANQIEKPFRQELRQEVITSEWQLAVPPEQAWNLIKEIDHLDGNQTFLHYLGLPTPTRCTLEQETVGALRTCYFEEGYIAERVTAWNPPQSMKLEITSCTLPGIHWLNFVDASYDFIPQGDSTLVIRRTTISSKLYPAWYWRRFEHMGVKAEHDYLYSTLKKKVEELSQQN